MSYTVLIPARMASSRLPDKPLADIAGLPMVVRVAQRAQQSQASRVVVAADDARIVAACQTHGIDAVLTRTDAAPGQRRFAVERLTQPNGFAGADGIFRLKTDGAIERGLAVIEVHPRASRIASPAPTSFEIPEN